MLPASKSSEVQCLSGSRVARLIYAISRTKPSDCSSLSATPKPSIQASQNTWKGREPIGYGVPVGEDQNGWSGEFGENLVYGDLHSQGKCVLHALPEEGDDGMYPMGTSGRNLR